MIIMTMMTMMMMMTMVTSVGTATTRAGRSAVGVSSHGVPHMLRLVVQARAFQAMGTPVGTTTVTGAAAMVERQHTIMVTYYYGSEDAMWIAAVVARATVMNEIPLQSSPFFGLSDPRAPSADRPATVHCHYHHHRHRHQHQHQHQHQQQHHQHHRQSQQQSSPTVASLARATVPQPRPCRSPDRDRPAAPTWRPTRRPTPPGPWWPRKTRAAEMRSGRRAAFSRRRALKAWPPAHTPSSCRLALELALKGVVHGIARQGSTLAPTLRESDRSTAVAARGRAKFADQSSAPPSSP